MQHSVAIKDKSECCGCGACAAICPKSCISMSADQEGFKYPSVDTEICINCGLCMRVCPFERVKKHIPNKVYAAKARNNEIQYKSSSGGAFEILASYLLENGYSIYGAAYSKDFSAVSHILIEDKEDLQKLRGSKYVQSDITDLFKDIRRKLDDGARILFSGTGCQTASLKSFLQKDYENLVTVDILCHGVPSPILFNEYVKCIRQNYGNIISMNMKDKTNGWGHQKLRISAEKKIPEHIQGLWYSIFYSRVALRSSCYKCPYMDISRPGDISLGDYWGIENIDKEFYDKRGVSLVLLNTAKGEDLFNDIVNRFNLLETDIEKCMQPVLSGPQPQPEWRHSFWDSYYQNGFKETAYRIWGVAFGNIYQYKLLRLIKRLSGR